MRISDWSSDVCSSDLLDEEGGAADRLVDVEVLAHGAEGTAGCSAILAVAVAEEAAFGPGVGVVVVRDVAHVVAEVVAVEDVTSHPRELGVHVLHRRVVGVDAVPAPHHHRGVAALALRDPADVVLVEPVRDRKSEEHTSELQSLMRTSSAVFCLKKKK